MPSERIKGLEDLPGVVSYPEKQPTRGLTQGCIYHPDQLAGNCPWCNPQAPAPERSILDEAKGIVEGEARKKYGSPSDNARRIAESWDTYLRNREGGREQPIDAQDVAMLMVLLKVVRQSNRFGRDNLTDIAGWAAVAYEANER